MKKDRIEEVYGELEAFSKEPPKELWDNIEARLHPKKKRRGILWFWGSAAAVLVMFVAYMFSGSIDSNSNSTIEITDVEQPIDSSTINKIDKQIIEIVKGNDLTDNDSIEDALTAKPNIMEAKQNNRVSQNQAIEKNKALEKNEKNNNIAKRTLDNSINSKKDKSNTNTSYAQNIIKEKNSKVIDKVNKNEIPDLEKKNKTIIDFEKNKAVVSNDTLSKIKDASLLDLSEELLAENTKDRDSIITTELNSKWSIEVLGGLTNTSAVESSIQNTSVNTSSQNDFVYALKLGHSITDKLVVKSGIGKNILGQEINNISYVSSETSSVVINNHSQNIVDNQNILFLASQLSASDFSTSEATVNEGILQQRFDYIQVPLEFSYNLLNNKKVDLSLGVGGNVNFLTNNRAFLDSEQIGGSLGVDRTIFGGTLNSNISYELAKKMILFLEPSFNYFEKPIDNRNQSFNNTQLRVLFGLRYKF